MKGELEATGNINLLKTGPSSRVSHFYKAQISPSVSKDWKSWLPAWVAFSTAGTCAYFFHDKAACPRSRFPGSFILQPHQEKHYQRASTDAGWSGAHPHLVKMVMYLKSLQGLSWIHLSSSCKYSEIASPPHSFFFSPHKRSMLANVNPTTKYDLWHNIRYKSLQIILSSARDELIK